MRTQPDPMDNLFGALFLFPLPRSYLDRNLAFFMFARDEQEPSPLSMPDKLIGFANKSED